MSTGSSNLKIQIGQLEDKLKALEDKIEKGEAQALEFEQKHYDLKDKLAEENRRRPGSEQQWRFHDQAQKAFEQMKNMQLQVEKWNDEHGELSYKHARLMDQLEKENSSMRQLPYKAKIDFAIARAGEPSPQEAERIKKQIKMFELKLEQVFKKMDQLEKKADQLRSQGKEDEADAVDDQIVQLEVKQEEIEMDISNAQRDLGKFDEYGNARSLSSTYRGRIDRAIATAETARALEAVFPPGNQWHDRIFYDTVEGKYYDKYSDVYLSLEEMKAFGSAFRAYGSDNEVERVEADPSGEKKEKLRQEIQSWDRNIKDLSEQIKKHENEIKVLEEDLRDYQSERMKALDKLRALQRSGDSYNEQNVERAHEDSQGRILEVGDAVKDDEGKKGVVAELGGTTTVWVKMKGVIGNVGYYSSDLTKISRAAPVAH